MGLGCVTLVCRTAAEESKQPERVTLEAQVRDFRPAGDEGGHVDFQTFAAPRPTVGLLMDTLDPEGRPRLRDSEGVLAAAEGSEQHSARPSRQMASSVSFASWFCDGTPGVRIPLVMELDAGTGAYVFDSARQEPYRSMGGFWPVDDALLGNDTADGHNGSFTVRIDASFVHERGAGQSLTIACDDDAWVYVNGRLVVDLGGVHPVRGESVEFDRLAWLRDGERCFVSILRAERRCGGSNLRLVSAMALEPSRRWCAADIETPLTPVRRERVASVDEEMQGN